MSSSAVVFVHGWGGSFARTWQEPGWAALVEDAGRSVIGVDLLGHGTAPRPHDDEAYADLTTRISDALPSEPVDAVGFSLGAITLLELACREPHRFSRLVVMGVGANLFRAEAGTTILDALEGRAAATDITAQLFVQYANQPGNDPVALACVLRRPARRTLTPARLAALTMPVLVVLGDKDFAGPADPLIEALPNARLVTLRNTDHFATTESFAAIDATLDFLGALPA